MSDERELIRLIGGPHNGQTRLVSGQLAAVALGIEGSDLSATYDPDPVGLVGSAWRFLYREPPEGSNEMVRLAREVGAPKCPTDLVRMNLDGEDPLRWRCPECGLVQLWT